MSDAIDFSIYKNDEEGQEDYFVLKTNAKYLNLNQEVSCTYNGYMLDSYSLLEHYGIALDNNIFAHLGMSFTSEPEAYLMRACETSKCTDLQTSKPNDHRFKLETHRLSQGLLTYLTV